MTTKATDTVSEITRLVSSAGDQHSVYVDASGNTVIEKNNVVIATITDTDVDFLAPDGTLGGKAIATYPLPPTQLPQTSNIRAIYGYRIDVSNPNDQPTITVNKGQCVGDDGELIELTGTIVKRIDMGWVTGPNNGCFCGSDVTVSGGIIPPPFFQNQLRANGASPGLGFGGTAWFPTGKNSANITYDYETEAFTPVSIWIVKTNTGVEVGVGLTADGSDVAAKIGLTKTVLDKRRIGWRLVQRSPLSPVTPTNMYPTGVIGGSGSAEMRPCRQVDDRVIFHRPFSMHLRPNDNWASYFAAQGQVTRFPIPPNLVTDLYGYVSSFVAGSNGSHGNVALNMMVADFEEDFSVESGLSWLYGGANSYGSDIGCSGDYNNYQHYSTFPLNSVVSYPVVASNANAQYGKYRIKIDNNIGNGSAGSSIYSQYSPTIYLHGWTDSRGKDNY